MPITDEILLMRMRALAAEDKSATEILQVAICDLAIANARLSAIICFREAFGITLGEAKQIGAWHKFPDGTWSDEKINTAFVHLLADWKSRSQSK